MMPNHLDGDTRMCPVTGKERTDPYRETWTDRSLPGVFNRCPQCAPNEYVPAAERLHRLNDERAKGNNMDICLSDFCGHPANEHEDTADAFCTVEGCACSGLHLG